MPVLHLHNNPATSQVPLSASRSRLGGDRFFTYANGEWLERTQIPLERAAFGIFSELDDIANKRTRELIFPGRTDRSIRLSSMPCEVAFEL